MSTPRRRAFDLLFEHSSEALLVVNGSGEVVEANESAKSALGPSLVGRRVDDVFAGTSFPSDYRQDVPVIRSRAVWIRSPEGGRKPFKITSLPFEKDGVILIGRDMGRSEAVQKEIERLRQRVRTFERERRRAAGERGAGGEGSALRELEETNLKLEELNRKLVRELDLAAALQRSLIPKRLSAKGGVRCAFRYDPMGKVGGDYFDIVDLQKGRIGVIVADVSGHGVSSAFISAMLKMFFINFARSCASPSELFERLNREYCGVIQTGEYVTAFYAVFDPRKKQVTYCGAGHPSALLYHGRDGGIEPLASDGFFIGMFGEARYEDVIARFEAGDRCLLYTDGMIEAYSERRKEQFGETRLLRSFRRNAKESLDAMVESMVEGVKRFMGKSRFMDDLTIVSVEHSGENERN